jgi:hypothetical protein
MRNTVTLSVALALVALLGLVACRQEASEEELTEMATARDRAVEYLAQYYDGAAAAVGVSWDAGRRLEDEPPFSGPLTYAFAPVGGNDGACCFADVTKLGSQRYRVAFTDSVHNVYWIEVDLRSSALTESGNWFGTIVASPPGAGFDACLREQYSTAETCIPLDAGSDADMLAKINRARDAGSEVSIVGTVAHEGEAIHVTVTELYVQETGRP